MAVCGFILFFHNRLFNKLDKIEYLRFTLESYLEDIEDTPLPEDLSEIEKIVEQLNEAVEDFNGEIAKMPGLVAAKIFSMKKEQTFQL